MKMPSLPSKWTCDQASWDLTERNTGRSCVVCLTAVEDFVVSLGGERGLLTGWYVKMETRKGGETKGKNDVYYWSPEGARYRSPNEAAHFFNVLNAREITSSSPPPPPKNGTGGHRRLAEDCRREPCSWQEDGKRSRSILARSVEEG